MLAMMSIGRLEWSVVLLMATLLFGGDLWLLLRSLLARL